MKQTPDIQRRIDEALASVDNLSRALPKPFFYTRLEGRLLREDRSVWGKMGRMLTRPVIALASVTVVLMLNTFVVVKGFSLVAQDPEMTEVASIEDLHSTSFYDIENNQP